MFLTYFLCFDYKSENQRDRSVDNGMVSVSFHNQQVISLYISGKRDYFLPETIHFNIIYIDLGAILDKNRTTYN